MEGEEETYQIGGEGSEEGAEVGQSGASTHAGASHRKRKERRGEDEEGDEGPGSAELGEQPWKEIEHLGRVA